MQQSKACQCLLFGDEGNVLETLVCFRLLWEEELEAAWRELDESRSRKPKLHVVIHLHDYLIWCLRKLTFSSGHLTGCHWGLCLWAQSVYRRGAWAWLSGPEILTQPPHLRQVPQSFHSRFTCGILQKSCWTSQFHLQVVQHGHSMDSLGPSHWRCKTH